MHRYSKEILDMPLDEMDYLITQIEIPPVSEREEEEAMNNRNENIKGSDGGDSLEGTDSDGSQDSYEVDDDAEDVKFPLARSDDEDSESKTGGNDKVDPDGK
jgi:hypothetical protein